MKFQLIIEVDVENATTESEGRKAAYDLGAILNNPKKGRRAAGPSASVTGIRVESAGRPTAITGSVLRTHSTDGLTWNLLLSPRK